jgi:hypothetical protein
MIIPLTFVRVMVILIKPFFRMAEQVQGPFEKFVDWQQCTTVIPPSATSPRTFQTALILEPRVFEPGSFKVEIAIEMLSRYKLLGIDQSLAELIQAGGNILHSEIHKVGNILHSEIHKVINSVCNREELPLQWKESVFVPIYEKGDETDCSNYRVISLFTSYIQNIQYSSLKVNPRHR